MKSEEETFKTSLMLSPCQLSIAGNYSFIQACFSGHVGFSDIYSDTLVADTNLPL